MKAIQENIQHFLSANKIATISAVSEGNPYSIIVYFVFDRKDGVLIFKSSHGCFHENFFNRVADVSGTILPEKGQAFKMNGLQFKGKSLSTEEVESLKLGEVYHSKLHLARLVPGYFWAIRPEYIKFTDFLGGFAEDTVWHAPAI